MHWYTFFGKEVGFYNDFIITENWGLSLLICGLIGANATGWVSDHLFQSRRAPMCAILYGMMAVGAVALWFASQASVRTTQASGPAYGSQGWPQW